jgi:4'-phosphopantetheinyl transferase EntD
VDAEVHDTLPSGTAGIIMSKEELERLDRNSSNICWDRIVFSAKESTYKAWFPIAKQWLDFHDVTIAIDPHRQTFRASVSKPLFTTDGKEMHHFDGHFLVESGLILTVIAVRSAISNGTRGR